MEGVKGVFIADDYVTVTKEEELEWNQLSGHIFSAIANWKQSGEPLVDEDAEADTDCQPLPDDDEVHALFPRFCTAPQHVVLLLMLQWVGLCIPASLWAAFLPPSFLVQVVLAIKELLEARIKPMVQRDGGNIRYIGFEEGIVYLQLQGACSTCPSSTNTLKGRSLS